MMNLRKTIYILIIILIALLIVALAGTFLIDGDNVSFDVNKGDVSIAVTGDVMFARNMANVLTTDSNPFAGVDNVTSKVDLLLVNFENAATDSSSAVKGDVPLKTSPSYVPLLKNNNNTIAALANNHVFDYGIEGMRDTSNNLESNGIPYIGAGENSNEANKPITQEINGRKITIFNYMDSDNFKEYSQEVIPMANDTHPGYSAYDKETAQKDIAEAKENGSDFVLVYAHYGNEYSRSPNEMQINISHELIDAGADAVLGSHPHVTQGIEMYNGKPIFYSLGNFIFDQSNAATHRAYFVQIDLINNTGECTVYPVNIVGYLPQFMTSDEGRELLEELSPQCDQLEITENGTGKLNFDITT